MSENNTFHTADIKVDSDILEDDIVQLLANQMYIYGPNAARGSRFAPYIGVLLPFQIEKTDCSPISNSYRPQTPSHLLSIPRQEAVNLDSSSIG